MCNFSISFNGSAEELVNKATKAVAGAGGNLTGDTSRGDFSLSTPVGKIQGSYTVTGNDFNIAIAEKPFFVSCGQIEAQLRKYLDNN